MLPNLLVVSGTGKMKCSKCRCIRGKFILPAVCIVVLFAFYKECVPFKRVHVHSFMDVCRCPNVRGYTPGMYLRSILYSMVYSV